MPYRCLLALLAVVASCANVPTEPAVGHELFVLGVAQDGGLPHLGCDRACCAEARAEGRQLYPVSLGVHERRTGELLMIEASPAIEAQVALLHATAGASGRGRAPVDALALTHAHVGHYAGLVQLGREVAGTRGTPLWVTPRFASFLRSNGPWSQLVELGQVELRELTAGEWFEPIAGLKVRAIAVPHRDEFSDTVAYQIRGATKTVLFVPDIDRWDRAGDLLDRLLDGVDVAFLDGSFYDGRELPDRDLSEIPHPPMVDTMRRLAERARARPGSIRFLHFNHTNPVLRDAELRREVESRGFGLARRGDRVEL